MENKFLVNFWWKKLFQTYTKCFDLFFPGEFYDSVILSVPYTKKNLLKTELQETLKKSFLLSDLMHLVPRKKNQKTFTQFDTTKWKNHVIAYFWFQHVFTDGNKLKYKSSPGWTFSQFRWENGSRWTIVVLLGFRSFMLKQKETWTDPVVFYSFI